MKKLFAFSILMIALILVIGTVISCGKSAPAQPVVLRVAMDRPPGSFDTDLLEAWATNFNQRASGSGYSMKVYPSAQLATMEESLDMVKSGAIDMAFFDLQYASSNDARFGAMGLPLTLNDPAALKKFSKIIKDSLFNDILETKFNQHLLAFQGQDFHTYCGNKPIKTLDDWKGLIIQTASPLETQTVKALGGAPTAMGFMDVVPSLEKGVIDGAVGWNAGAVYLLNAYDSVKYINTAPISGIYVTISINLDTYKAMPKNIQQIMTDEASNFESKIFDAFQQIMTSAYSECANSGIETYQLPAAELNKWREATRPVLDDFYAQLQPGDATKIKDAINQANQ
jgi:TRAP-type C4-dicarboxylate transport system substrate-binding protein